MTKFGQILLNMQSRLLLRRALRGLNISNWYGNKQILNFKERVTVTQIIYFLLLKNAVWDNLNTSGEIKETDLKISQIDHLHGSYL